MSNPWFFLIIAGVLEIGWPLGFKLSQTTPSLLIVTGVIGLRISN